MILLWNYDSFSFQLNFLHNLLSSFSLHGKKEKINDARSSTKKNTDLFFQVIEVLKKEKMYVLW